LILFSKQLHIVGHEIKQLPEQLYRLSKLRCLFIQSNEIEHLSEVIQEKNKSKRSKKSILKKKPQKIVKLKRLREIWLSENKLQKLPFAIGSLVELRELKADLNELRLLPFSVGTLLHLTNLQLQHNNLGAVPTSLQKLQKLTYLNLSYNELREFPPCLLIPSLRHLLLQSNKITTCPEDAGKKMCFFLNENQN
jgi:Leucine-rich repeat (LRR) protein